MTYPDTLLKEYTRYMKALHKNFLLATGNDRDGVHDMRVTLKRLCAFFRLLESMSGNFKAGVYFRPFGKFAKNTGGLRDSHVQQELVDKYSAELGLDLSRYDEYLRGLERENLSKFLRFSDKDPLSKLASVKKPIKATLCAQTAVWAETKAMGCLHNMRNQLVLLSREPDPPDEYLHNVRKLTKSINYTYDIVLAGFNHIDSDESYRGKIIATHKLLGNWHDYAISIGYIDKFLESRDGAEFHDPYARLKEYLADRQSSLRREAIPVLSAFAREFTL